MLSRVSVVKREAASCLSDSVCPETRWLLVQFQGGSDGKNGPHCFPARYSVSTVGIGEFDQPMMRMSLTSTDIHLDLKQDIKHGIVSKTVQ